jgi:hypothetical protein
LDEKEAAVSFDAVYHAHGPLAEGSIALAEVQGYVYPQKKLAAWCAKRLGFSDLARQLQSSAAVACCPHAWASGAFFALLQAISLQILEARGDIEVTASFSG